MPAFDRPAKLRTPLPPRSDKSVENRLRNLEQIMAMMSRESTDKAVTLSEDKLAGIWAAAQCSPESAGAQPSNPPHEGVNNEGTPTACAIEDTPGLWMGYDEEMGGEVGDRGLLDGLGLNGRVSGAGSSSQGFTKGDIIIDNPWFTPSADAGPSTQSDPEHHLSNSGYGQEARPSLLFFQSTQAQVGHSATSTQSRHNLLYQ